MLISPDAADVFLGSFVPESISFAADEWFYGWWEDSSLLKYYDRYWKEGTTTAGGGSHISSHEMVHQGCICPKGGPEVAVDTIRLEKGIEERSHTTFNLSYQGLCHVSHSLSPTRSLPFFYSLLLTSHNDHHMRRGGCQETSGPLNSKKSSTSLEYWESE